jgi:hypothetical protein
VLANPVRFLDPDGRTGQATLAGAVTGGPVGAIIGFAVDLTIAATAGAVAGAVAFSMAHPQPGLCITGPESLYTCEETRVLFASPSVPGDVPKDTEAQHAQSLADARTQVGDTKTAQDSFGGPLDRVKPMSAAGKKSGGKSGAPAAGPRPEKSYYGGKKHGLKWTEASSRAKKTGNPQGKWGSEQDLDIATQNAATLGVGESGSFSLPANTTSTVTMPDGTVMQANSMTVINNGETWHGFPTVR